MKKGKKKTGSFPLFLAAFGMVFLLLMGILGEWGLMDLLQLHKKKADIIAANTQIAAENQALTRRIFRLKNDRQYVESVVRQELGVVKDGELIIKMPPIGKENDSGPTTKK
jgi:cell division protein FtsB